MLFYDLIFLRYKIKQNSDYLYYQWSRNYFRSGAPGFTSVFSQVVGLPNNSYKLITNTAWVRAQLCKLQKGQFSPGTPASSTIKTGRHDIAEILLKVALNTKNQSILLRFTAAWLCFCYLNPFPILFSIRVITKLPNTEQSS